MLNGEAAPGMGGAVREVLVDPEVEEPVGTGPVAEWKDKKKK